MMKKGMFGISLHSQVLAIGGLYCVVSLMGITVGFLLLHHPDKFSGVEEVQVPETLHMHSGDDDIASSGGEITEDSTTIQQNDEDEMYKDEHFSHEENDDNEDEDFKDSESSDKDEVMDDKLFENNTGSTKSEITTADHLEEDIDVPTEASEEVEETHLLRSYVQDNGVEVLVESGLGLACALVLIHGVRTGRHWLLVPWLVDSMLEMVATFLHVTVQAARGQWDMSASFVIGILCFYFLGGYCLYSVASFHVLLRRMNKNSDQIINSVCQGGLQDLVGGGDYRRLEEDAWQAEPNITNEFRRPTHGFSREQKVGGRLDHDEHVLYVQ